MLYSCIRANARRVEPSRVTIGGRQLFAHMCGWFNQSLEGSGVRVGPGRLII